MNCISLNAIWQASYGQRNRAGIIAGNQIGKHEGLPQVLHRRKVG